MPLAMTVTISLYFCKTSADTKDQESGAAAQPPCACDERREAILINCAV